MEITQQIIEFVRARYHLAQKWTGRPGYLGFGLLGLAVFVSGVRNDNGMGFLLVTAIIAFVGEQMRLIRQKGSL